MTPNRPTHAVESPGRTVPAEMISLPETARRLGIARNTIYEIFRRNDPPFKRARSPWEWIPVERVGRQHRIRTADVDRYLAGRPVRAKAG